jgi:hypothetical protein
MSDSSRVQLAYGKEVSWGVIPAVAFTEARMTGEVMNAVANVASLRENGVEVASPTLSR